MHYDGHGKMDLASRDRRTLFSDHDQIAYRDAISLKRKILDAKLFSFEQNDTESGLTCYARVTLVLSCSAHVSLTNLRKAVNDSLLKIKTYRPQYSLELGGRSSRPHF